MGKPWVRCGVAMSPEDVEEYEGFVYIITNTVNNKRYIGKKRFWFKKAKKPLKGKKKRRISYVPSDWQDYYGSSPALLEDVEKYGKDAFTREIIHLCKTTGEMNYWEGKLQYQHRVLELPDEWYNEWIIVKISRSHLPKSYFSNTETVSLIDDDQ